MQFLTNESLRSIINLTNFGYLVVLIAFDIVYFMMS